MAVEISTIQEDIIADLVAAAADAGVDINPDEWSDYDYRQLLTFIAAGASGTMQQLFDSYRGDLEALIAIAPPHTPQWIQNFVLNLFQYNAAVPQIVKLGLGTIAPYYDTPNALYRIVTQCVVVPGTFGTTTVQAAKETPAVALTTGELEALQSSLNLLGIPGITINAVSKNADKIRIAGTVTYIGQYSGVLPVADGTVAKAIQAYLASIPASGVATTASTVGLMKLTDLIAAVRAVPGVIDFELNDVNARPDLVALVPGSNNMVTGNDWVLNEWNSGLLGAGYMLTEDTAGNTINDTLIFEPQ